jgi:glycosyltransferase involved in cell wall biosynthesis
VSPSAALFERPIPCAFILPSFSGGGAERAVLTLIRTIDRARIAPSLIVIDGRGPLADAVPSSIRSVDLGQPRFRRAVPALWRVLRSMRVPIALSTLPHTSLALLAGRHFLPKNMRIVVREPNTPSQSTANQPAPWLFRLAYRRFYPRAAAILCNAQQTADELATLYRVPRARLHALPNPIATEEIRAQAYPIVREAGSGLRFVAAGRLVDQKGFDRLLDMLPGLAADTHLTILGDGPRRPELVEQTASLGLADRVRFAGYERSPWKRYAGADAFLLPSRYEGMSNAALEALACGTRVIGTPEAGGLAELAQSPGVTLAASGQPFVNALRQVPIRHETELGASLLPRGFEPTRIAERLAEILERVVGGAASCD